MAKLLKKDEPIQVQFGAAQAAEPPVVNLANRGKYGADYFGKKQADGEGLWHAYAEQIRKTNEERQRAWDEFNAAEVAAAKKKNDHHAHRMALQVSGFGRYKTAQAQRIADARLKKQRLDMQQDSSSPATTAAAAPGGRGGGERQRPVSAPSARDSAERRCAEIQGRRDAWRNARGMVWPVQRWFADEHANFDSDARQRDRDKLHARFAR